MHRRVFLQRLGGAGALLAGMSLLEACSPATPASQPPASSAAPATDSGPRGQVIVALELARGAAGDQPIRALQLTART